MVQVDGPSAVHAGSGQSGCCRWTSWPSARPSAPRTFAGPSRLRRMASASARLLGNVGDRLWTLWQHGQSGADARGGQAGPDALGDVADWLEPGGPNLRVRQ